MKAPVTAALTGTLLAVYFASQAAAQQVARVGRAYDTASGKLLYLERHVETVAGNAILTDDVTYVDAEGRTFATKRVDFQANPFVPDFKLTNGRTGHLEALSRAGRNGVDIRFREAARDPLQQTRLEQLAKALADAGFDRFIESHWEELIAGEQIVRHFLVPSRLEFMAFRIRRDEAPDEASTVTFVMEIDSTLLRLVVSPIVVTYDRMTRRLVRYAGLSNIRDENGDNFRVEVVFD